MNIIQMLVYGIPQRLERFCINSKWRAWMMPMLFRNQILISTLR